MPRYLSSHEVHPCARSLTKLEVTVIEHVLSAKPEIRCGAEGLWILDKACILRGMCLLKLNACVCGGIISEGLRGRADARFTENILKSAVICATSLGSRENLGSQSIREV